MSRWNSTPPTSCRSAWASWPRRRCCRRSSSSCSPTSASGAMTGEEIARATRPARAGDPRLPRRARRAAASSSATATASAGALPQHAETAAVPRQEQPDVHRRHPRDGQRAAVPLLGRPHRGAADRQAAERGQAHRHGDVRGALQRPGAARAVHGRDGGHLGGQLPRAGREVRLLRVRDGLRRRRRHRPAVDDPRRAPSAPALHELRPAGRRADRRRADRGRRARATGSRPRRATSSPTRCRRPTSSRWA